MTCQNAYKICERLGITIYHVSNNFYPGNALTINLDSTIQFGFANYKFSNRLQQHFEKKFRTDFDVFLF